jgi:hypothetical protein
MKKTNYILLRLIPFVFFLSCNKDKLNDEYNAFEGSYEWTRSTGQKGSFLTLTTVSVYQKDVGYTVTFELNNKGEALFYRDGNLISKNNYRINGKESNQYGGKEIIIKLKGDLHNMNIKDEILKLSLSNDTALTLTNFPFPAIDKIENYKPDYSGSSNTFRKK